MNTATVLRASSGTAANCWVWMYTLMRAGLPRSWIMQDPCQLDGGGGLQAHYRVLECR